MASLLLDPYRLEYAKYFDWSEGRLDSLFVGVKGTVINGIGMLGLQNLMTRFNYFQALSRFYESAVLSDLPQIDAAVHRLLHRATEHWSVCGETFLVRAGGQVRAVRPDYVFPQLNQYDREQVEQYLFVFPKINTQEQAWDNEVRSTQEATVIEFNPVERTGYQSIRPYSKGVLEDGPRGQLIDMTDVVWVRSGHPPYVAIEPIMREICVRLNMLQLALNTSAIPILQVDKDNVSDGAFRAGITLEQFQQTITSPMGMNIAPPFAGEEGSRYVERAGTGLTESLEYIRMLLGQLGVLSGVPDYVFGVQLGRPNNETERVLFAGQTRVNSFRRELQAGLSALGQGDGFFFGSDPFITRQQRIDNAVALVEAQIITASEAKAMLGLQGEAPAFNPERRPSPFRFPADRVPRALP